MLKLQGSKKRILMDICLSMQVPENSSVGSLPQLIEFIRFGEPVPHGLSARPQVRAGFSPGPRARPCNRRHDTKSHIG